MSGALSAQDVHRELGATVGALIAQGLATDQNFPSIRRISALGWEVSFQGAEHVSVALGRIEYDEIYRELAEKRSYSVRLLDGALMQLMYIFENDLLVKHRLAFLPSPNLRPFQEDPDVYLREELFVDVVSRHIVPFPLRFDFDESAAGRGSHPRCHLTLGDVEGCRIPVSRALTPRWFVEFVVSNFYRINGRDFVTDLPRHRFSFPCCITEEESELIHVVVPDAAAI